VLWTYLKDNAIVYSDLHLTLGEKPAYRDRAGRIVVCTEAAPVFDEDIMRVCPPGASLEQLVQQHEGAADFAATVDGVRYRVNASWHDGQRLGIVMRRINDTIPALNSLGLPNDIINTFLARSSGIIQITGATGSG
jgi:Tfp pilus assembly pilus retraction ATPase PilT